MRPVRYQNSKTSCPLGIQPTRTKNCSRNSRQSPKQSIETRHRADKQQSPGLRPEAFGKHNYTRNMKRLNYIWGRLVKPVNSGAGKVRSWTANSRSDRFQVGYCNRYILTGDLMRREASAHTTVAWLAYVRFIEEWVVAVDAVNNEKYGNINSGVILQVFYYTQDNTTADGKKIRLLEPFEIYMNI